MLSSSGSSNLRVGLLLSPEDVILGQHLDENLKSCSIYELRISGPYESFI